MAVAADRTREDVTEAFQIFSTLRPPKELDAYFEVIELVLALLEASKDSDLVFLSFKEFAKVHGPNLPSGLMKARDDLDRAAVGEVMDSIKRRVKEEGITDRERD